MAAQSHMLPLGTPAPPFSLPDTDGKTVSIDDFGGARALLVMFICEHCPYVQHVRGGLASLGRDLQARDVAVVAINANDWDQFPDDSPEAMRAGAARAGYTFPYLVDEAQHVAKAYGAACTPDFFLFDGDRRLVYRGQMDSSRPGSDVPVTGQDLRGAADAVLTGREVDPDQRPSMGCSIKWRPGNEPS